MSAPDPLCTKALVVFCEGSHDVAFCKLVFKKLLKTTTVKHKLADFPAPLNSLFKTSLEDHLLEEDMSLDMAHKFFLPDAVLSLQNGSTEWMVLLFNCGGKNRIDNPKSFLENYRTLSAQASVFPGNADKIISASRYLFIYDADDKEPQEIFTKFGSDFSVIAEEPWVTETPRRLDGFDNAAKSGEAFVYTWSHNDKNDAQSIFTLEDIVFPIFRQINAAAHKKTELFIDDLFHGEFETKNDTDKERIAAEAKRKKAVITVLGQGKKPGSSMNVIIEQSGLIKEKHLTACQHVKKFLRFLHQTMASENELDCPVSRQEEKTCL